GPGARRVHEQRPALAYQAADRRAIRIRRRGGKDILAREAVMRTLLVVSLLSSFAWLGCGGGHAKNDGAGGIGGTGGGGGTTVNDAGADHPCGAPAQTYTFATER